MGILDIHKHLKLFYHYIHSCPGHKMMLTLVSFMQQDDKKMVEINRLEIVLVYKCTHMSQKKLRKSYIFIMQNTLKTNRKQVSPTYMTSIFSTHYSDVTMGAMASPITSLTIVYSTVYSGADQRKHQSYASLAFVRGIHRWPVNSPHKWPVTRKMFPFDDVIMKYHRILTLLLQDIFKQDRGMTQNWFTTM